MKSDFWSGWFAGMVGFFFAVSLSHPDAKLLYVMIVLCAIACICLKNRRTIS